MDECVRDNFLKDTRGSNPWEIGLYAPVHYTYKPFALWLMAEYTLEAQWSR
jgi:hypothetical protein